MESEEKLQRFYEKTIQEIDQKAQSTLSEYEASLKPQLEEYKELHKESGVYFERQEEENLKKAARQAVSREVITQKHLLAQKEEDYIERIFIRVGEMLDAFRKTDDYKKLLVRYIYEAIEFAREDELIIYLDLDDAQYKDELEARFGREIRVSRYSFGGGLRALIPERNILIENSFSTKRREQLQSFDINA